MGRRFFSFSSGKSSSQNKAPAQSVSTQSVSVKSDRSDWPLWKYLPNVSKGMTFKRSKSARRASMSDGDETCSTSPSSPYSNELEGKSRLVLPIRIKRTIREGPRGPSMVQSTYLNSPILVEPDAGLTPIWGGGETPME
eukprot:Platyproteum_vivax@DN10098_c0_g1_i1.p1